MSAYNAIPDTAIRQGFITALSGISTPIFDEEVPKSVIPIPAQRVLLSSQITAQHDTSKCGHLWMSTILLDIISEQDQGYSNRAIPEVILNDINLIIDTLESINIPGFKVYNTQVLNIHDASLQTSTKTVNRKLVRYQFLLGPQSQNGFPYIFPFQLS